ncbi:DNA helicase PIF1, ATP-dependent [Tanacetum coccineum]
MNIRDTVPPLRRPGRPRSQSNVMPVHRNVRPCFTPNNDVRNTSPTLTPAVMLSSVTVVDNNGNAVHQPQSSGVLNLSHSTRSANHANVLNTSSSTRDMSHLTNFEESDTDLHTSVYRDARKHRRMRQYVDSGDATIHMCPLLKPGFGMVERTVLLHARHEELLNRELNDGHGPYAISMARDRFHESSIEPVTLRLIGTRQHNARQYNLPTASKVAALIPGDGNPTDYHDYPLLFPYGEDGFHLQIPLNVPLTTRRKYVSLREYYCFRLQNRNAEEACWKLLGYEMHYQSIDVERLPFHEEGCNRIYFRDDDDVNDVLEREITGMSKFTGMDGKAKRFIHARIGSSLRKECTMRTKTKLALPICTGKTYLWKTIIARIRSLGRIVLSVASSGIASLLLQNLHVLIRASDLIIWDEAPLQYRHAFEAVDRTFRDIYKLDNLNAEY